MHGPGSQILVERREVRLDPPRGDRVQVDGPGGADERAGPARLALLGLLVEGRAHFARGAAAEEVDRPAAHHLVAHPRAQPAENALLPGVAWNGVDSTPSPAANSASSRESGAWASSNSSTVRRDSFTRSVSVWTTSAVVDRVAARGHQLAAARRLDLDQADAARAVGRQPAIVAQRGDRHAHLPRGVEDRRAARDLRRAAVDVDQNLIRCGCAHASMPLQPQRCGTSGLPPWHTGSLGELASACRSAHAGRALPRRMHVRLELVAEMFQRGQHGRRRHAAHAAHGRRS